MPAENLKITITGKQNDWIQMGLGTMFKESPYEV